MRGVRNELAYYLSRHRFEGQLQIGWESLAADAFRRMDEHLDLWMQPLTLNGFAFSADAYWGSRWEAILNGMQSGEHRWKDGLTYALFDHCLYEEGGLCIPITLTDDILQALHASHAHPGLAGMIWLSNRHVWETTDLVQRIKFVLSHCHACVRTKPLSGGTLAAPGAFPVPHMVNTTCFMDFVAMPQFNNFNFLLVMSCGLSLFVQAWPCEKRCSGEDALNLILNGWVSKFGPPQTIHADNDVRWKSSTGFCRTALEGLGIKLKLSAPYCKMSNSPAERSNRRLLEALRALMAGTRSRDWPSHLPAATVGCNLAFSPSRGSSPHFLFLGNEGNFAFSDKTKHTPPLESLGGSGGGWACVWLGAVARAREGVVALCRHNLGHAGTSWAAGDLALVHPSRLSDQAAETKLDGWLGPYVVASVEGHRLKINIERHRGGIIDVDMRQAKKWTIEPDPVLVPAPQGEQQAADLEHVDSNSDPHEEIKINTTANAADITEVKYHKGWRFKVAPHGEGPAEWVPSKHLTETMALKAIDLCKRMGYKKLGAAIEGKLGEDADPVPVRFKHCNGCNCHHCRYRQDRVVQWWNRHPTVKSACSTCSTKN